MKPQPEKCFDIKIDYRTKPGAYLESVHALILADTKSKAVKTLKEFHKINDSNSFEQTWSYHYEAYILKVENRDSYRIAYNWWFAKFHVVIDGKTEIKFAYALASSKKEVKNLVEEHVLKNIENAEQKFKGYIEEEKFSLLIGKATENAPNKPEKQKAK